MRHLRVLRGVRILREVNNLSQTSQTSQKSQKLSQNFNPNRKDKICQTTSNNMTKSKLSEVRFANMLSYIILHFFQIACDN